MARVSEEEKKQRLATIAEWIGKGYSKSKVHVLIENQFRIGSCVGRNKLIASAMKEMGDTADRETALRINSGRIEAIIEKAMLKDDLACALRAVDMANKLAGLYVERKEVRAVDTFEIEF